MAQHLYNTGANQVSLKTECKARSHRSIEAKAATSRIQQDFDLCVLLGASFAQLAGVLYCSQRSTGTLGTAAKGRNTAGYRCTSLVPSRSERRICREHNTTARRPYVFD